LIRWEKQGRIKPIKIGFQRGTAIRSWNRILDYKNGWGLYGRRWLFETMNSLIKRK
jgi:hypothetical protein